jgi:hypothetical protein
MDTLLTLEPRVAGADAVEPRVDFTEHGADLHAGEGRIPQFCKPGGTVTQICYDSTKICIS